ncbi:hypothetical protein ACSBR2_042977 [Camellia fascicularis]
MADHKSKRWKLKNWKAILMNDFKEIHSSESGLNSCNRCFQVMHLHSSKGIQAADLKILREKLEQENSSALITEQSDEEDDV